MVRIAAIHGGDQRAGVEQLLSETAVGPRAGGGAIGGRECPASHEAGYGRRQGEGTKKGRPLRGGPC